MDVFEGFEPGLELRLEFDKALKGLEKIPKRGGRQHDRVTPSTNVLGDLQKPSTLVLFEIKKEYLPVDRHLFRRNRVGAHSFTWIVIHMF